MKYWITVNTVGETVTTSVDLLESEAEKLNKAFSELNNLGIMYTQGEKMIHMEENREEQVRTTVISDLHGNLPTISECDLLCICGDVIPLNIQNDMHKSKYWFTNDFRKWINNLPCKKVLMIAGNHDKWLEQATDVEITLLEYATKYKLKYLKDELYETMGLKIYGTPNCTRFGNWSFMYSSEKLTELFEKIPDNVDILLTHDAPYGMQNVGTITENDSNEDVGSVELRKAILRAKPKYTFCGHVHSGNHKLSEVIHNMDGMTQLITEIANVSLLDESYALVNKPLTLNISLL